MSVADILLKKDNAAQVRRLIRARCPILKDGAYAPLDGRITGDWFRRRVVSPALLNGAEPVLTRVAGHRLVLAPTDLRVHLEPVDRCPLPDGGAATFVHVLPIAPHRMYASWQVDAQVLHEVRLRLQEASCRAGMVLRFFDVTDNTLAQAEWFDVNIEGEKGQRYLEVGQPGRRYHVELGLLTEGNHFCRLADPVTAPLPRDGAGTAVAPLVNVRRNATAIVRPAMPGLYRSPSRPVRVESTEADWPLRDLHAEQAMRDFYQQFLREGSRALRSKQPLVRPENDVLHAAYDRRTKQRKQRAQVKAVSPKQPSPRPIVAVRLDEAQPTPHPVQTQAHLPSVRRQGRLSLQELGKLEREQTISRLTTLASRGPLTTFTPPALPAPETLAESAPKRKTIRVNRVSHLLDTLASSDLDLEAELVLRGRVKAGKKVRIGGEVIETEPDGSFCVSVVIKDGKIHVPVEVVEGEIVTEQRDVSVDLGQ